MTRTLDDYGDVFVALADPNRRIVLERLAKTGETTATVLAHDLPISRQAVVKHLVLLDRARLIHGRKQGREMRYRVDPARLTATALGIEAIANSWDNALLALKRAAEAPPSLPAE